MASYYQESVYRFDQVEHQDNQVVENRVLPQRTRDSQAVVSDKGVELGDVVNQLCNLGALDCQHFLAALQESPVDLDLLLLGVLLLSTQHVQFPDCEYR